MNGIFGDLFDLDHSGGLDFFEQTTELAFIGALMDDRRREGSDEEEDDADLF